MDFDLFLEDSFNYQQPCTQQKPNFIHDYKQNPILISEKQQTVPAQQQIKYEQPFGFQNASVSNIDSSKKMSSILAGKRARQKKKMYIESLQARVKEIQQQVVRYDDQIRNTKETLSRILHSSKYNQNSLTYAQIQACIQSQDPNQDRINMLLDMIRFRVGGLGIQRQAKIDYFLKQLVNTFFPPFQRYLMYCCEQKIDIFQEPNIDYLLDMQVFQNSSESSLSWTKQLLTSLNLTQNQKNQILRIRQSFGKKKTEIIKTIDSIIQVKNQIRDHQKGYEQMISQIRSKLNPIQGGAWLLFCDRIRYKRQIVLDNEKELYGSSGPLDYMPQKKIKKD